LVFGIIVLFVGASLFPIITGSVEKQKDLEKNYINQTNIYTLKEKNFDINYIFNITAALSNIIFTEYDEDNGEIAKGRAFGTKGEHKAAEILYENMTKLGLCTKKEQLKSRYPGDWIPRKLEVLDYQLVLNNGLDSEIVDCAPQMPRLGFSPFIRVNESELNHNYSGLKIRLEHPSEKYTEDYVLIIEKFVQDFSNLGKNISQVIKGEITKLLEKISNPSSENPYPHCKGGLIYYTNNGTHDQDVTFDQNAFGQIGFPRFYINRTIGKMISNSTENFTIDFVLNRRVNTSVESYNVIGQLKGKDNSKTVIVCCLYDSWWCQGTGDSAIGMAIVLGIAKYFIDNNILPKYKMKFIGFSGEEYGFRGSRYYERTHKREEINYVIDLNQLGFKQESPRLHIDVFTNSKQLLDEIMKVVERTNYVNRTGNTTDLRARWGTAGHASDDFSFAFSRPWFLPNSCKTVCFLKNGQWLYHHRDGMNHTKGDVLDYFDRSDVSLVGEMIINVTKYLVVDNDRDKDCNVVKYSDDFQQNNFGYNYRFGVMKYMDKWMDEKLEKISNVFSAMVEQQKRN